MRVGQRRLRRLHDADRLGTAGQQLVGQPGQGRADDLGHPEQPQLTERPAAREMGRRLGCARD